MAQLEADHVFGSLQLTQLLLMGGTASGLLDQVLEQQCILAHALHRLQQVGGQIHLVTQCPLLVLQGPGDKVSLGQAKGGVVGWQAGR